jgi:hypothetical protein
MYESVIELAEAVVKVSTGLESLAPAPRPLAETLEDPAAKERIEALRPQKLPFGVSPRGAELYVAEWLKFLNFVEIEITPPRRDGGYDLRAEGYIVEVKNWNRDWVGVSAVREIYGVATHLKAKPMIFSRGFLSADALAFSESAQVSVFLFNAEEALLQAGNSWATQIIEERLALGILAINTEECEMQNSMAHIAIFGVISLVEKFYEELEKLFGGDALRGLILKELDPKFKYDSLTENILEFRAKTEEALAEVSASPKDPSQNKFLIAADQARAEANVLSQAISKLESMKPMFEVWVKLLRRLSNDL